MAYFSNGTEGMIYEEKYCMKCSHNQDEIGCPIWDAHLLWNYEESDKPESILHKMIPMDENYNPDKCNFFIEK